MTEVQADFTWRRLGTVDLTGGRIVFPSGPPVAGIWRVSVGEHPHHGAAKDLRAAMYALTTPGPTQTTNQRIHDTARAGLAKAERVIVDVITTADVNVHGRQVALDLDRDEDRAFLKAAAVLAADNPDPDPASADYRRALAAAQETVAALAATKLMAANTTDKPAEPRRADVKLLREAAPALQALVAAHDRYWPDRWGHEGNPV